MSADRRPPAGDPRRRATSSRPVGASRRGGAGGRGARGTSAGARSGGSDLSARVIVAIPAALLAIGFVDLGGTGWALFMAVFGVLGLTELYRMLDRWRPVPWVGYVVLVGMCAAARFGGLVDVIGVAMLALPLLLVAVATRPAVKDATVAIAGTLLGVFWLGMAFAHAVLLRQLPHGGGVVIDVLVGTFFGDIGAYFGGRAFGHRRLAPEISPNKTVEGLIIGMIVAIVAVFVAHLYQSTWMTQTEALGLGLAIALLGPVGDLFESLVKRDAGAKDAGRVFGAHGGVLDRLDAVAFTVIAGYYLWALVPH
ncbi:phosphatidate cytidylyltransferase [Conexibacter sp. DBS9H8]|uniref:phosphatidate cytidylyltransferase n=1 Tax=Conexibacter sp. DBS9H8 TaxID=2937801 RepID=UPI00200C7803|nr:phosphatidate cytidylyltransferase [Conexibacter sp. DBS9H8]